MKPGGRLAVSDVVARRALPDELKNNLELHGGCLAGATPHDELLTILRDAGFEAIEVRPRGNTDEVINSWDHKSGYEQQVFAAEVTARKPG